MRDRLASRRSGIFSSCPFRAALFSYNVDQLLCVFSFRPLVRAISSAESNGEIAFPALRSLFKTKYSASMTKKKKINDSLAQNLGPGGHLGFLNLKSAKRLGKRNLGYGSIDFRARNFSMCSGRALSVGHVHVGHMQL